MRNHNATNSFIHQRFERCNFDFFQSFQIMRNNRQIQMGIFVCITVTRKMFNRGQNSVVLQTIRISQSRIHNIIDIGTETSVSNNWIIWIGINIYNWRKIPIDSHSFAIFSNFCRHLCNEILILNCTQSYCPGIFMSFCDSLKNAPFGIHSYHQWHF